MCCVLADILGQRLIAAGVDEALTEAVRLGQGVPVAISAETGCCLPFPDVYLTPWERSHNLPTSLFPNVHAKVAHQGFPHSALLAMIAPSSQYICR